MISFLFKICLLFSFIPFHSCFLATGKMMDRRIFLINGGIIGVNDYLSCIKNSNALIIGCDKIGKEFAKELANFNLNTIATTTKITNIPKLKKIVNDVVLIPQMEIGRDEVFREVVYQSPVIIIADVISIFSIHTFVRTCMRITKALENKNIPTVVCLISSVNAYGAHTDGAFVNENSPIVNQPLPFIKNNNYWQINHISNAKAIRLGESYLYELAKINENIKPIVLRTSAIWNDEIAKKEITFNEGRTYPKWMGNSYISFSYTDEIANAGIWAINNYKNDENNLYNIASTSVKRNYFYNRLIKNANKKPICWVDNYKDENINDHYYSLSENPLLPNAMRYNLRVDCSKIINNNYKFKHQTLSYQLKKALF